MKYMLYCHNCNNKVFTNGDDLHSLVEIATASIQRKGDGISKELVEQKKKLKCPQCGFVFKIVKLEQPKVEEEKLIDDRQEPKDLFPDEPKKKKK